MLVAAQLSKKALLLRQVVNILRGGWSSDTVVKQLMSSTDNHVATAIDGFVLQLSYFPFVK